MCESLSPAHGKHLRSISCWCFVVTDHFPTWCSGPAAAAQTQALKTTIMSHLAHEPPVGQHLTAKAPGCSSIYWGSSSEGCMQASLCQAGSHARLQGGAGCWLAAQPGLGPGDSVACRVSLSLRPVLSHSVVAGFPGAPPQRESCVDAVLLFMTQHWKPHSVAFGLHN